MTSIFGKLEYCRLADSIQVTANSESGGTFLLKSVLYGVLFATTTLRLADIIYLLARGNSNLPGMVFIVTGAVVVYGAALLVKRLSGNVTIKQFMLFFAIHAAAVVFNLSYIAATWPLRINSLETVAVGTFLDILIDICAVYFCTKQIRSRYFEVQPIVSANRHG